MNRHEAVQIADRLWEIVNGPTAGTSDPEALDRVTELAAEIQHHPDLTTNLKLKADNVVRQCRVLFDEDVVEKEFHGDVDIAGALARNAVIELRLIAERQLPAPELARQAAPPATSTQWRRPFPALTWGQA